MGEKLLSFQKIIWTIRTPYSYKNNSELIYCRISMCKNWLPAPLEQQVSCVCSVVCVGVWCAVQCVGVWIM